MRDLAGAAARLLDAARTRRPRVHAITNAAAQAFTANLLLAVGAIPSLTVAQDEVEAFAARADALLLNLGTLDAERRAGAPRAFAAARGAGRPVALDPVFAEASPPRLAFAREILAARPDLVRCNASEFEALFARAPTEEGLAAAARASGVAIALTGAVDLVGDGERRARVANGHPTMARVTAMGCAGTALAAAFLALEADRVVAASAALLALGVAGEIAGERAAGPGSFPAAFLDALDGLDARALEARGRAS